MRCHGLPCKVTIEAWTSFGGVVITSMAAYFGWDGHSRPRARMWALFLVVLMASGLAGCQGLSRSRGSLELTLASSQPLVQGLNYKVVLTSGDAVKVAEGVLGEGGTMPVIAGIPAGKWDVDVRLTSVTGTTHTGEAECIVKPVAVSHATVTVALTNQPAVEPGPAESKGSIEIITNLKSPGFDGLIGLFGWTLYKDGVFYAGDNYHRSTMTYGSMFARDLPPGEYGLLIQFMRPDGTLYYTPGVIDVTVRAGANLRVYCTPPLGYDEKGYTAPLQPTGVEARYSEAKGGVSVRWRLDGVRDDIAAYYVHFRKDGDDDLSQLGPFSAATSRVLVPDARLKSPGKWGFWVRSMDRRGNTSAWPAVVYADVP